MAKSYHSKTAPAMLPVRTRLNIRGVVRPPPLFPAASVGIASTADAIEGSFHILRGPPLRGPLFREWAGGQSSSVSESPQAREQHVIILLLSARSDLVSTLSRWSISPAETATSQLPHNPSSQSLGTSMLAARRALRTV